MSPFKSIWTLSFCFLLSSLTWAQDQIESVLRAPETYLHQRGTQVLNLSSGFKSNPTQFSLERIFGKSGSAEPSPSINLSYEYGISQNIGIGALVGFYRVNAQQEFFAQDILNGDLVGDPLCLAECLLPFSITGNCDCSSKTVEERVSVLTIAGKISYHIALIDKVDTYTTITAGLSVNRRKTIAEEALNIVLEELNFGTKIPSFVYYAAAGARYYITPSLAIFGEVGYSNVHLLKLGASYRW